MLEEKYDMEDREVAPHHFLGAVIVVVHDLHAFVTLQIRHCRPELELQDDKEGLYSAPLRPGEGGHRCARADGGHRGAG